MTDDPRYARHIGLFGVEGQERIAATSAAIVGLGGLGCHVAQQVAYLGVSDFALADADAVSESNLNRLVGAGAGDVGAPKVEIAARVIRSIQPDARVDTAPAPFNANSPPAEFARSTVLFGCVDEDPARLEAPPARFGAQAPVHRPRERRRAGRRVWRPSRLREGRRALPLVPRRTDQHALARAQMTPEQRTADDRIYGIERDALDDGGPSVVSINGVVASLAITEFMAWRTGLREPAGHLNYRGDRGTVGRRADPERTYCHYCMTLWGAAAD